MPTRRRIALPLLFAPWVPGLLLPAAGRAASPWPAVGDRLDLVDLPLLEGGRFDAAKAKDRVVVIYWWASWCPFCAEMSPSIEALWRAKRDQGLTVLGVSIDRQAQAALAYRSKKGYTFPSTLHAPSMAPALAHPGVVPATWVRDRRGRIVLAEKGQLFPEDVEQLARFV